MSAVECRYSSGSWLALVGPRSWLLADLDSAGPVLDRCWPLIRHDADPADVVAALVGEDFRTVQHFAYLKVINGQGHLLVRGGVEVELAGAAPRTVSAAGLTTWVEQRVDLANCPAARFAAPGAAVGAALPLVVGAVRAASLEITLADPEPVEVPEGVVAEPAIAAELVPGADPEPCVEQVSAKFDHMFGATIRPEPAQPSAASPPAPRTVPLPGPSPATEPALPPAREPASVPSSQPAPEAEPTPEPQRTPEPAPRSAPRPASVDAAGGGMIVMPTWENGAAVDPAPSQTMVLEGGAPNNTSVVDPAHTVLRSSLPVVAAGGPTVPALVCLYRHANPPSARFCRVCGADLAGVLPVVVSRPSLGVLRLSDGGEVPLVRGVLLGREPTDEGTGLPSRPHVVTWGQGRTDVSRNHVEVTVEDWTVSVTDLRSTNGTAVTPPGEPPRMLEPGVPHAIEPGTVVTAADGVSFRYEVGG